MKHWKDGIKVFLIPAFGMALYYIAELFLFKEVEPLKLRSGIAVVVFISYGIGFIVGMFSGFKK